MKPADKIMLTVVTQIATLLAKLVGPVGRPCPKNHGFCENAGDPKRVHRESTQNLSI